MDKAAIWLWHLGCGDIVDFDLLKDYRIWVGHFHPEDFSIEDTGLASFGGITHNLMTKYTECCAGYRSKVAPPRPAATKSEIEMSIYYRDTDLSYGDYQLTSKSCSGTKKRKARIAPTVPTYTVSELSSSLTPIPKGRKESVPYFEVFIGMALLLMNLVKTIHSHGRTCKGELRVRRSKITLKRFSLQMRFTCSLSCNCSV